MGWALLVMGCCMGGYYAQYVGFKSSIAMSPLGISKTWQEVGWYCAIIR